MTERLPGESFEKEVAMHEIEQIHGEIDNYLKDDVFIAKLPVPLKKEYQKMEDDYDLYTSKNLQQLKDLQSEMEDLLAKLVEAYTRFNGEPFN